MLRTLNANQKLDGPKHKNKETYLPMTKSLSILLFASTLATLPSALSTAQEVTGNYYDWQRTMKPEQPWQRDYTQTVVMKILLCERGPDGNVSQVHLTFEDALDEIKKLDNVTLGVPKIVYLVGWQFTGHDSGYPSWSVVNNRLKRPQDKDSIQSLRWLMKEGKRYHTTVSLHINMSDAYKNSPLWDTYDKQDIILKDKSGEPIKGEVFGGMQSYQISYAQEWRTGFSKRRIDALLAMLPELRDAGTIHIDAFHSIQPTRPTDPLSSPYLGLTVADEMAGQRTIVRYWRSNGIDVTTEYDIGNLKLDPFIGLTPMVWWYSLSRFADFAFFGKTPNFWGLPPTLYTGTPLHGEEEIKRDPKQLASLAQQFCENVVPWYLANSKTPTRSEPSEIPGSHSIFLSAGWLPSTIVACRKSGPGEDTKSEEVRHLPQTWAGVSKVRLMPITADGLVQDGELPVKNNTIELHLPESTVYDVQK